MAQAIPVNGDGTFDDPTWGESGSFSDSAYEGTGCPNGTLIGPNDFNQPRKHAMRWIRALRDRQFPSDQGLFDSCMIKTGTWNVSGGTLDGTLTVSWVMIDASDDGGVVVEVAIGAGSPHTFGANKDTYVNLNESGAVEYQEVPTGDPTPTPTAGYINVWMVQTDGAEITAADVMIPTVPTVKSLRATGTVNVDGLLTAEAGLVVTASGANITGNVTCNDNLTVLGNTQLGNAAGDTLTVPATSTFQSAVTVSAGGVDVTGEVEVTSSDATAAAVYGNNTSSGPGVRGLSGTSYGVLGSSGGSTGGVHGNNSATGPGVSGVGGATSGPGVSGTASAANSPGVQGTGAAAASSHGVSGVATNTGSYGVFGTTAAAATTSAAGVRAEGLGDAPALSAVAASGNAARLESDTSSPARAPLVIVPQDTDASTTQVGSLAVNSSRFNKIRHHDGSNYLSVHSSAKGHVDGWAEASDSSGTSSGNIAAVTIVAEEVGTVLIEATGAFSMTNASYTFDITIYDVTESATVRSVTVPVAVASELTTQVVRAMYTLPDAGSRQFCIQLDGNTNTLTWSAVVLSVRGVG